MSNNLTNQTLTIDSREVAEMMGKEHKEILQYIEGRVDKKGNSLVVGIVSTLESEGLHSQKYFIPSTYRAGTREYKCYLCTKMGCELLGNKQQGAKGILFTAKYVEKFNEMEQRLLQLSQPSYMIEDPIARAERWIEEQKEKKALEEEKNKAIEDKNKLIHTSKTYTASELAKELGFRSAKALNETLREMNIIYKCNGTWLPKANYAQKGYMETKQKELDNGIIKYYSKWTGTGRDFLLDLFKDE